MYADFNRFQLKIKKAQALAGSHQGECYEDVKALLDVPAIARQFDKIPAEDIKAELKEWGAWDEEELSDDQENRIRILWIACGNIVDEIKHNRRPAIVQFKA